MSLLKLYVPKMALRSLPVVELRLPNTKRLLQPRAFTTVPSAQAQHEQESGELSPTESGRAVSRPRRMTSDLMFPIFGRMGTMMRQFEDEMNNMFRLFDMPTTFTGGMQPDWGLAVDVREDDKQFIFTADVPGMEKGDVKIKVSPDHVLTITGERKKEKEEKKDENVHYVERSYGTFMRRFRLPDHVDVEGITAKQENGVLTLAVPKTEKEEQQEREIEVN